MAIVFDLLAGCFFVWLIRDDLKLNRVDDLHSRDSAHILEFVLVRLLVFAPHNPTS